MTGPADGLCRHCDGCGCIACDARHLPVSSCGRFSRLIVYTPEQIASKLAELRADASAWKRLERRWGSLDDLLGEIETYEWLSANDSLPDASNSAEGDRP